MEYQVQFPTGNVTYYTPSSFYDLAKLVAPENCVVITDDHIQNLYGPWFDDYQTVVIPAGEANKNWQVIEGVAHELVLKQAHKQAMLIGVGGGVITDITGFVASTYMRGIRCAFVPTSLLAMVDAAIGGKNGVNLGWHKNMLGTIRQPEFILYDTRFLETLPQQEWSNGFAEIIKYGCLFDRAFMEEVASRNLDHYEQNRQDLQQTIEKCVGWKNEIVLDDERETGRRKLLNFGHTLGHAIENQYDIPHGAAVAVGMVFASYMSEQKLGSPVDVTNLLRKTLANYGLPTHYELNVAKTMEVLGMDKKRDRQHIDYVLLRDIGKPEIVPLPLPYIQECLEAFQDASLRSTE